MKRFLLLAALLFSGMVSRGQTAFVRDGVPADSVFFDFGPGDSLRHISPGGYTTEIDTSGCLLWQTGSTTKMGFLLQGSAVRGIMTDTLNSYPANQDDYFIIKGFNNGLNWPYRINPILTFEHRYQTIAGQDGGCVELSNDSGATWKNIFQLCNDPNTNNNQNFWESVHTENFYTIQDTLANGVPAFSGNSNGYVRARLQLLWGMPMKPTQAPCDFYSKAIWVRFRFISDSTADTLAGWNIRRIVLEYDDYGTGVRGAKQSPARLSFSPNPSATGVFHLDDAFEITPGQRYEVRNTLGAVVISGKPEHTFDLSGLPKGLYWIQIRGKERTAGGKVLVE